MNVFVAALAAAVALPLGGAVGYAVKHDPTPKLGPYLLETQGAKHVNDDSDDWFAMATTGPNKGGAMELIKALSFYRTQKDVERAAMGKVVYVERKCELYSTTGHKVISPKDKHLVTHCSQILKTRKQAEDYMVALLAPEPKA